MYIPESAGTNYRGAIMAYESGSRPKVTSYDSGYEHSLEHWFETRTLFEEVEEENNSADQYKEIAVAAKAS